MSRFALLTFLLFSSILLRAQPYFYEHGLVLNNRFFPDTLQHTSFKPLLLRDSIFIAPDSQGYSRFKRKLFYEHLINIRNPDYSITIDFLPDVLAGYEKDKEFTWLNTRGFEIQGHVTRKFAFQTAFYENQADLPSYLDTFVTRNKIIPGQGFGRGYGKSAWDFAYSTAYMSWSPNSYINLQLGQGKNFIGDGYRSLLLSDAAFPYPFLKMTADVWKFRYQVLYAQFIDMQAPKLSFYSGYRRKYGTFHSLDWSISPRLNLGLFEAVVWQDADSAGKRGFDLAYVNPIIFLRPVEFGIGSPDNALVGLNIKWKAFPKTFLYGQFLLDEFKAKELKAGKGWWANKFGGQLGVSSTSLFSLGGLKGFTELNMVKPFTYAHGNPLLNYAHYNQSLAHPLGSNFYESVSAISYTMNRWTFRWQFNYARYGKDSAGTNFGSDLYKSYNSRSKEYDNYIGQGVRASLYYTDIRLSFLLNPVINLRLEAGLVLREEVIEGIPEKSEFVTFGLRSSFRNLYYDF